ncbi:putative phosphoesterase [Dysgonomonadaceae bacterium PH5-43]|nr:putative phosphoesterase [Dysgonomonadaceae bacterium PH5-43]
MTRIGLLSDTHAYWDERYVQYFSECDEIWHAGDIGSEELLRKLNNIKPVRAVYGNIDSHEMRKYCPEKLRFTVEDVEVYMIHIGGYPGKYALGVLKDLYEKAPKLFVCGHSHILKIMYDKRFDMLTVNPGAAGKYGFHQVRTIVRFDIDGAEIKNMEIIELTEIRK